MGRRLTRVDRPETDTQSNEAAASKIPSPLAYEPQAKVVRDRVPVTIKSLVFSHDPRVPHRHAHDHHHP